MFPGVISTDLEPHGIDGPVGSSFSNYQYPVISKISPLWSRRVNCKLIFFRALSENFFAGWDSIGIAINPQPNNGEATGAFYSTISAYANNQSRSHASNAYYRPIANVRKNLHLMTGHLVTKINFDQELRAVSVDVSDACCV